MVQEEKDLLLKELSSRYPYGVILHFDAKVEQDDEPLYNIRKNGGAYLINDAYYLEEVKPYLRSMESMTEEEKKEYRKVCELDTEILAKHPMNGEPFPILYNSINWCNKNHFDYSDLIKKGLAIKVSKENNPYK